MWQTLINTCWLEAMLMERRLWFCFNFPCHSTEHNFLGDTYHWYWNVLSKITTLLSFEIAISIPLTEHNYEKKNKLQLSVSTLNSVMLWGYYSPRGLFPQTWFPKRRQSRNLGSFNMSLKTSILIHFAPFFQLSSHFHQTSKFLTDNYNLFVCILFLFQNGEND